MNNYIDGFFRSLAMPSTADNMYEAGAALGRWIEEYNRHDWPKDSPDEGLNPPADTSCGGGVSPYSGGQGGIPLAALSFRVFLSPEKEKKGSH